MKVFDSWWILEEMESTESRPFAHKYRLSHVKSSELFFSLVRLKN